MFTWIGTIVAWLVFATGLLRLGTALVIMFGVNSEQGRELAIRSFGSTPVGHAIDQAVVVMAAAIALGILAEISRSVRRVN